MNIELSPDHQTLQLSVNGQTVDLTGQQVRDLIQQAGNLAEVGFPIPPVPSSPEPARLLGATAMLRLPANAKTSHPPTEGAGIVAHSPLFGHFVVPLSPADCKHWGSWLLGTHPMHLAPPDSPLN